MNLKGERVGDIICIEGDGVYYERSGEVACFEFTGKVNSRREIRCLIKRLDRLMSSYIDCA